jgi:hypothetical protein
MNTNHQILEAPPALPLTTNIRRQALWQTSLILAFIATLLSALLGITSCQSPVEIDTPRNTKADITWQTTLTSSGKFENNVATLNGVEPEAVFSVGRISRNFAPNASTATFSQGGYVKVNFKNAPTNTTVSYTAGSPLYQNYGLATFNGKNDYPMYLGNLWNLADINTGVPVQFNTTGYTLSDNKADWLGKVEITSHKNDRTSFFGNNTIIQRGQPLTITWSSEVIQADGAEVTLFGYKNITTTPNSASYNDPLEIKRSVAVTGVNTALFTADETNSIPVGSPVYITVRYFKAKTVNDGKAVIVSNSEAFVEATAK